MAAVSVSLTLTSSVSSSSSTSRRHSVSSSSCYISTSFYLRSPKARSFLRFATPCPSASLSAAVEAPGKMPKVSDSSKVLHFVKYQGLGNDFILVDNRESMEPKVTPEQAVKLCDRNFGVGADGVIFAMPGVDGADYSMRIFNSDGSEPEMCGNGVRCIARFIAELETIDGTKSFTIQTGAGLIIPEIQSDGKVRVDMGQPTLKAPEIPTKLQGNKDGAVIGSELMVDGTSWNVTCVSMGNPHCITFGTKQAQNLEVDDLNLADIGPKFEHHLMFPARTNTEFIQVFSRTHLKMRVWERGAGATLACGTGACAVVVAAVLEGRSERKCTVDLSGGPLEIEWKEEDNHVYMTGPAEVAFYGSVRL